MDMGRWKRHPPIVRAALFVSRDVMRRAHVATGAMASICRAVGSQAQSKASQSRARRLHVQAKKVRPFPLWALL
jgi:hypothetical protein